MRTLSLSEVKAKLSELVDDVEGRDERVVITRKGRPAAVLVSHDEMESWQETLEIMSDPELMAKIRRARARAERAGLRRVSDDELDRLLGPAPRKTPGKASRSRVRVR